MKCGWRRRLARCWRRAIGPFRTRESSPSACDLFSGAIEDRYVGAFLDPRSYAIDARDDARRPDRVDHRNAARRGALELRESPDFDRRAAARHERRSRPAWSSADVGRRCRIRSRWRGSRASIGWPKAFIRCSWRVREGRLLDIIDIGRWASGAAQQNSLTCARPFQPHARATAAARARVRRAQPVARDQDLRGRDRDVHVSRGRPGTSLTSRPNTASGRTPSAMSRWRRGSSRRRAICRTRARERCSSSSASRRSPCRSLLRLPIVWICRYASPTRAAMDRKGHRAAISFICWNVGRSRIWIRASSWDSRRSMAPRSRIGSGRLLAAGAILRHPPSRATRCGRRASKAPARPRRWRPVSSVRS